MTQDSSRIIKENSTRLMVGCVQFIQFLDNLFAWAKRNNGSYEYHCFTLNLTMIHSMISLNTCLNFTGLDFSCD